jgi:hypothetical protein
VARLHLFSLVGAFNSTQNGLDPGDNATWQIAGAESRHKFVANDVGGPEVRQCAFQTITDFDADFAIFERDKEEDPIIGPLPP